MKRLWLALLAGAVVASGCSLGGDDERADGGSDADAFGDPGDCTVVDMSVSPEKTTLLGDLARRFNTGEGADVEGRCVFVRPQAKSSGGTTRLLAEGWDEAAEGPRPVVWSPAASTWAGVLNQRLADDGEAALAPPSEPFMLTPLVIAMPEPMAGALGYPDTPVSFSDLAALAEDPAGWGAYGHPEWGPFRLGKTNPNFSTSGLSALLAQYYAATGKTEGLSLEDLDRPEVVDLSRRIESAVVHYGDITLTFLNNLYRSDQRGASFSYASAVAVEEKSVIDYNRGNPDGVLDPGEEPRPPRVPLVAVYPEGGTIFSDNPYIVLDAEWVSEEERAGAELFEDFVKRPENQEQVLESGFRPGNPAVALGDPLTADNGVDPDQPATTLEVPDPRVMIGVLDRWAEQRKSARVLLLVDVSGSMGEEADPETGETRLDLAKRAAVDALDQFKDDDEVGLRIFSTDISGTEPTDYTDVVPIGPVAEQREELARSIRNLVPTNGTPLYTATLAGYEDLLADYDPARINALLVLSDGKNEDPRNQDLGPLIDDLAAGNEGQNDRPVRIFPIAFSGDADLNVLEQIAEATNAAAYDASDPTTIDRVFTAVVSNF
ncbi:MAG: substrate-binding and VWA domain-containing protein [Actinomycetota bacterium]|nr:substrate-binding and VWA domain-containing protein [Actinomycetota bacterium]